MNRAKMLSAVGAAALWLVAAGPSLAEETAAEAAGAETPAAPAAPTKPAPAKPQPPQTWFEVAYAYNYLGDIDGRIKSDTGARADLSVGVLNHLNVVASYDHQDYSDHLGAGDPQYTFTSVGVGTYLKVWNSTNLILNGTWETLELHDEGETADYYADGWGVQGGVRTMFTRHGEFSLTFKHAEYDGDHGIDEKLDTVTGMIALPLTRTLDLTFRIENVDWESEAGGVESDTDLENYLVGLRAHL